MQLIAIRERHQVSLMLNESIGGIPVWPPKGGSECDEIEVFGERHFFPFYTSPFVFNSGKKTSGKIGTNVAAYRAKRKDESKNTSCRIAQSSMRSPGRTQHYRI
ncbi:hypothetical protein TNCV_3521791 [Trichonephila clavipes]|nr:hypothetical protein TNCV_3521791 [Trichonephila clavipes]